MAYVGRGKYTKKGMTTLARLGKKRKKKTGRTTTKEQRMAAARLVLGRKP